MNENQRNIKLRSNNKLIRLLIRNGQIAEHKTQKMQEHQIDEDLLVQTLTKKEQVELMGLLTKLRDDWIKDHKKRMLKQGDNHE